MAREKQNKTAGNYQEQLDAGEMAKIQGAGDTEAESFLSDLASFIKKYCPIMSVVASVDK